MRAELRLQIHDRGSLNGELFGEKSVQSHPRSPYISTLLGLQWQLVVFTVQEIIEHFWWDKPHTLMLCL